TERRWPSWRASLIFRTPGHEARFSARVVIRADTEEGGVTGPEPELGTGGAVGSPAASGSIAPDEPRDLAACLLGPADRPGTPAESAPWSSAARPPPRRRTRPDDSGAAPGGRPSARSA